MSSAKLDDLRIDPQQKSRPRRPIFSIFATVFLLTAAAIYFAIPRTGDDKRLYSGRGKVDTATNRDAAVQPRSSTTSNAQPSSQSQPALTPGEAVLTVSGYIIARERIELSPRFMGMVKWIGVKKGDSVTNQQVVVLLDDAEYAARLKEAEGRLAAAKATQEKAELQYNRVKELASASVESLQVEDDYRLNLEAAKATVKEIEGQIALLKTYLDWCIIRSPINGVVLEKLVDPNELVTPQSFGGTRGPSTALIALADLKDLQVEIDLNEADVAKVSLNQQCRVSPEAYPDRAYEGYVAEMAPEANRQKGTLQVKVQIVAPDKYLTPELSAKVDFLKADTLAAQ